MRRVVIIVLSAGLAGCATQSRIKTTPAPIAATPVVREAAPTQVVETRYEVRSYRDANDGNVRHDAHAVYRATRVPARVGALETAPRTAFAPASHAPLPPSTELAAEVETQRRITAELRDVKARMVALETQAQTQFGSLVNQAADSLKLRQQLLEERARVRELEAKLRHDGAAAQAAAPSTSVAAAEPKW